MIGQTIGPFRVLRKLGAGGMGEVFLAEDERLHRFVALKSPSSSRFESADAYARLQREARAAARLNDPRIAAIYDVLDVDGRPFIVMEWVDGETLSTALDRGPFAPERALDVGADIAQALIAAHAAGIIHRDLKPGNVMLTPDGRVKVLDFGVAKLTDAGDNLTSTGQMIGTPGYTAPEQLLGKADARSDVYSTGALLYELLTGRAPVRDARDRGVAALLEPVPDIRQVNASVPREIGNVVMRALSPEPRDRQQSARELADALARARTALGNLPTKREPIRPFASRRRVRTRTAIAVLLLGAVGLLLARWWRSAPPVSRTPVVAVLPFAELGSDTTRQYMGDGMADSVITSLASVSGLSVISLSEIHDALTHSKTVAGVCRALGATYVVTGGIQQLQDQLHVTVNLLSPDGGTIRSGVVYDDSLENFFKLQRRIAEDLTKQIAGSISTDDRARLASGKTTNMQAMSAYWRGRDLLDRPGADPIEPAIAAFEDAVKADPGFALGYSGLASAYWREYLQTKDPAAAPRAVTAAERARQLDANEADVQITLATIYNGSGRPDDAKKAITHALDVQPKNDRALRLLASIDAAQGQLQQAIAEYREAIAIRPDFWQTYRDLGVLYWNARRYQDAIDASMEVTRLQPDSPIGWVLRGNVHATMVDLDAARRDYETALTHGGSAATYSNLGFVSYYQGRFDDATRYYEQAVALRPKNSLTHWNLGDAYRQAGRSADARRAYDDARALADQDLRVNPKDVTALAVRGTSLARLDQTTEGLSDLEHAANLAPQNKDVQYHRALVLILAGRKDAAVDAVTLAVADGYSIELLRIDPDLKPLAGVPAFQALLAKPRRDAGRST